MKSALLNYARTVLGGQDPGEVLARHLDAIETLVTADGYAIYLLDAERGHPLETAAEGVSAAFLESYEVLGREEDLMLSGALDRNAPCHDQMVAPKALWTEYSSMMKAHGYSHAMVAPIPYGGRRLGTINFIKRGAAPFRATESKMTQMAAEFLGIAVGHALEHHYMGARARAAQWAASKVPVPIVIATSQGELIVASDAVREFGDGDGEELIEVLLDASTDAARGSPPAAERRWRDGSIRSVSLPDQDGVGLAALLPDGSSRPRFDSLRHLLTSREIEVLELAASGLHDQEIAAELTVSVYTVKQHLKNAYGKLGVRSRTEAAGKAFGTRDPDLADRLLRAVCDAE